MSAFMNDIRKDLPTPYYYYHLETLARTIEAARFWSTNMDYQLHYAVKANTHPRVLETLSRYGVGADCVSGGEIEQAMAHGFVADKIVFAGVGKTDAEIRTALSANIFCFNVESLQELEVLAQMTASSCQHARICLRVSPQVDAETHAYVSTGHNFHKFGIREDQLELALNLIANAPWLCFAGLHVHVGSQVQNLEVFARLCWRVNRLQDQLEAIGVKAKHINVGGGLGVDYSAPTERLPDFKGYFTTLKTHLERRHNQQIHVELGRSLVAACGSLITRVLYVKPGPERTYVIVDAGMSELLRPALYGSVHPVENLTSEGVGKRYWVAGPVCESADVLAKEVVLPEVRRGDIFAIRWAGAYGEVMASRYNLRPPLYSLCSDEVAVENVAFTKV
ncbi:MAG: diaminopimelate decarboxylase [Bacteroidota bacterium]